MEDEGSEMASCSPFSDLSLRSLDERRMRCASSSIPRKKSSMVVYAVSVRVLVVHRKNDIKPTEFTIALCCNKNAKENCRTNLTSIDTDTEWQ